MKRGKFITFEGGEGSGKSTQARLLWQRLRREKIPADLTREPGGTPFAEAIRSILLDASLERRSDLSELLLFYAARADHLNLRIRPKLISGEWVVCDRFSDSTRAYQKLSDESAIDTMEELVVGRDKPDLTIILDVEPEVGMRRAVRRAYGSVNSQSKLFEPDQMAFSFAPDRFEGLGMQFHDEVRQSFLNIARRERKRCIVIKSEPGVMKVADVVWKVVSKRFKLPLHRTVAG